MLVCHIEGQRSDKQRLIELACYATVDHFVANIWALKSKESAVWWFQACFRVHE
jgi:hypothetical protein